MATRAPAPKLLLGYSDATALLEYVRVRWGWRALHAPMPGMRKFSLLKKSEWRALESCLRGEEMQAPWKKLKFAGTAPRGPVRAEVVGGNLSVWVSLAGTPFAGRAEGKMLFFEDIDEGLYRIDRMVTQLDQAGGFAGARGIVLGDFLDCRDRPPAVFAAKPKRGIEAALRSPRPADLKPLRKVLNEARTIREIFAEIGEKHGIPVAYGLPVGHGPGFAPLPLGVEYELSSDGRFEPLAK